MTNILLCTDVYKLGHMQQYPKGTNKVYSYLMARSSNKLPFTLFFGLQYYLQQYLSQPITQQMADDFYHYRESILGEKTPEDIREKIQGLVKLGYLPLKIKAVKEGTIMPVRNVLMTITNTHPDFAWVVGFVESILLKVWNTTTVASYSKTLSNMVEEFAKQTCDNDGHCCWQVHDFGYRGCSSEETAALSGAAHLINFRGTDTILAVKMLKDNYMADGFIGGSVPASEHSVMCAFGRENEFEAIQNMLNLYPSGIVSIVSDSYDLWNVLENFTVRLKEQILARNGKVVFRPDSGDPVKIICGDKDAPRGSAAFEGAIRILDKVFGSTKNSKGFIELNPKVGLIYGDGMYFDRFQEILTKLKEMGYATSNLVVGIGGLLLQSHSRDDLGFSIKATYCEVDGKPREIEKDPITDQKKKSHRGLLVLKRNSKSYVTTDQVTPLEERSGLLELVFEDGQILRKQSLDEIRGIATGAAE